MSWWVYVPILLSAVFGLGAPALARALPPRVATWLLSGGGLVAAAGSSVSLGLLAFGLIAQAPVLAAVGHWSNAALRDQNPFATPVAVAAVVAIIVLAARFLRAAISRLRAVQDAYRLAATFGDRNSELTVLETGDRHAFAVPGRPGRIVVTTGLLRTLDAGQRRALLAHERAHLLHRHHIHQGVGYLAAAVNPVLYRLPGALELSCERWADEDAAGVCRRDTVAQALLRAATATRPMSSVVLAAAAADVVARVQALHTCAPQPARWRVALLVGLLAATAVASAMAMHNTERLFELAQQAYRAGRR